MNPVMTYLKDVLGIKQFLSNQQPLEKKITVQTYEQACLAFIGEEVSFEGEIYEMILRMINALGLKKEDVAIISVPDGGMNSESVWNDICKIAPQMTNIIINYYFGRA